MEKGISTPAQICFEISHSFIGYYVIQQERGPPIVPNLPIVRHFSVQLANLPQTKSFETYTKDISYRLLPPFKISSRYLCRKIPKYFENLQKMAIFAKFFLPLSGFRTITAGRLVRRIEDIDKNRF